jgi:NADH:ubiquinone oxidoreductase subunit 6 (subunit J)
MSNMDSAQILFYLVAAATLVAAGAILLARKVFHAALALLAVLLGVAVAYMLLGATFLAVSQLMVYVGGVLLLLIFGALLTNQASLSSQPDQKAPRVSYTQYLGGFLVLSLCAVTTYAIYCMPWNSLAWVGNAQQKHGKAALAAKESACQRMPAIGRGQGAQRTPAIGEGRSTEEIPAKELAAGAGCTSMAAKGLEEGTQHASGVNNNSNKDDSLRLLGVALMSKYVLALEVVGILLLLTLVGASWITGSKP